MMHRPEALFQGQCLVQMFLGLVKPGALQRTVSDVMVQFRRSGPQLESIFITQTGVVLLPEALQAVAHAGLVSPIGLVFEAITEVGISQIKVPGVLFSQPLLSLASQKECLGVFAVVLQDLIGQADRQSVVAVPVSALRGRSRPDPRPNCHYDGAG